MNLAKMGGWVLAQQQYCQMSRLIVEKKFRVPEAAEMPTFRQLPTQMNTIPSISTIYYDRDHTHTRLDSDFKLHSRLPSLELAGLPLNGRPSVDSDLLNYSRSTFLAMPEDLQVQLKKILHLLGSKQHIVSHISHSVGLVNARGLAVGLEVGQIIADSFGEYVNIAQNLSNKLVKEELVGREEKISMLCKELSKLKHENAQLFENCRKLEEENTKYRRKISQNKLSVKINPPSDVMKLMKASVDVLFDKMALFQAEVTSKLGFFQEKMIELSAWRNNLARGAVNEQRWQQQTQKYLSINKQLHRLVQIKDDTIQKFALKENNEQEGQPKEAEKLRKMAAEKSRQASELAQQVRLIREQLNEQKKLYDMMLDKNIELQKQLFFMSQKENEEESLHIVDYEQEMSYLSQSNLHPQE